MSLLEHLRSSSRATTPAKPAPTPTPEPAVVSTPPPVPEADSSVDAQDGPEALLEGIVLLQERIERENMAERWKGDPIVVGGGRIE